MSFLYNLQLRQYQNAIPRFNAYDARMVAVSPEVPDRRLTEEEKTDLKFEVLSDVGNMIARRFTGREFKEFFVPKNTRMESLFFT